MNTKRTLRALVGGMGLLTLIGGSLFLMTARAQEGSKKVSPVFSHPTAITNPYLPLARLHKDILEGTEDGRPARIERTRKPGTKTFTLYGQSVAALIVEDCDFSNGKLTEVTLDYFAQADDGTVYYLGEDVNNYRNGKVVGHEGAWLSGVRGVQPGVIMPAHPKVGVKFQPEDVPGVTRESDEVMSVSETVKTPTGTYSHCVKIKETLSDGAVEYKYHAPDVGVVKEAPKGGEMTLKSHQ